MPIFASGKSKSTLSVDRWMAPVRPRCLIQEYFEEVCICSGSRRMRRKVEASQNLLWASTRHRNKYAAAAGSGRRSPTSTTSRRSASITLTCPCPPARRDRAARRCKSQSTCEGRWRGSNKQRRSVSHRDAHTHARRGCPRRCCSLTLAPLPPVLTLTLMSTMRSSVG